MRRPIAARIALRSMPPKLVDNLVQVNHGLWPRLTPRVLSGLVPKRPPKPVVYPVTDQWRRDVVKRMQDIGVTQAELARRIGCKEPTLTLLFRPGGTQKTKLMADIHEVLKLPPPAPPDATPPVAAEPVDPVIEELVDVIERLDDEWRTKLLDIARNFPVKPGR